MPEVETVTPARCEICTVPVTDENRGEPICRKDMVVCKDCEEYTICNECNYGYSG